MKEEKTCTVQLNYHVVVHGNYYSVPYDYYKQKVVAYISFEEIEIYYNNNFICKHTRLWGKNRYSTDKSHMPPNDYKKGDWTAQRFKSWAMSIGYRTVELVDNILTNSEIEQQGYKSALAVLTLTKKYSRSDVEEACDIALINCMFPRFKHVKKALKGRPNK